MKYTEKELEKDSYLKRKYGITLETYYRMLKSQNNACAICEKDKSSFKRALSVDHDHTTGEVRGLLCFRCNKYTVGKHTNVTVVKLVRYLLPDYVLVKKDLTNDKNNCIIKKKRR